MGQEQCCTQDKPLQRQNKMATFPRSVSLAVFRAHIENGLSVAIGVGITGLGAGLALDFHSGIAAAAAGRSDAGLRRVSAGQGGAVQP